jgi:diacylglycerol O-acyltransferase / wax synthase
VANIPGPSRPLYCMGARLLDAYPYVGPVDGMALMVSTVRYNGRLFFGLCADADAVPDLALLVEAIEKSAAELAARADQPPSTTDDEFSPVSAERELVHAD